MLKKLSKAGEYPHMFLMGLLLVMHFLIPGIELPVELKPVNAAPFGQWIYAMAQTYPFAAKIINLILMLLTALYINHITVFVEITPRQAFITATLLIALLLFIPAGPLSTLTLIVFALLIFCFGNLMYLFGKQYPSLQVLNASIAIALATMIIPAAIFYILFIWIAFLTHSVNNWREWVISLIGLILPGVYLLFAFFWNDNLDYLFKAWTDLWQNPGIVFSLPSTGIIISLSLLLLLYAGSMLHFINNTSDKVVSIRKRMWLTFQFSLITFMVIGLSGNLGYVLLPLLFAPTAIMISYYIYDQKRVRVISIILLLFLISVLLNRLNLSFNI